MPTHETEKLFSKPKGMLPNSRFPLLIHRGGVSGGGVDAVLERFRSNIPISIRPRMNASASHRAGMEVELFGRGGALVRVEADDDVVMPAGVSHSMVGQSDDIMMVGGYPNGRDWDNMQEEHLTEELRRAAAKRIMMCPIPVSDPVTGAAMQEWIDAPLSVDAELNNFRDGLDPI